MSRSAQALEGFFGHGNGLAADHPAVTGWVTRVCELWPEFPLILPRTAGPLAQGATRWYVATTSERQARRIGEELTATVGPTYATGWRGRAIALDPADPVEAALLALTDGPVLAFDVAEAQRDAVRDGLDRLLRLWVERPDRSGAVERRAGLLLRDFDLALASGSPDTAAAIFAELRQRRLLSAANEVFLEIVLLAAHEDWRAITTHRHLDDIAAQTRPWPVTRSVILALYRSYLTGAEIATDLEPFIERARDLDQRYPGIFRTRGPLDHPDVAKAFALVDRAAGDRPARTRLRVLEAHGLSAADREFLATVVEPAQPAAAEPESPDAPPPTDPLTRARDGLERGEIDTAWDLALESPPSNVRAVLLVQCAVELGTLNAAETARSAFDALPSDVREARIAASRRFARDLADLEEITPDQELPAQVGPEAATADEPVRWSWTAWFSALHERENWTGAIEVARGLAEAGAADPNVEDLDELIRSNRTPEQQRTFLQALPHLLRWFDDVDAEAAARPRRATLEALALQDLRGMPALESALHVSERLIAAGLPDSDYREVLDLLAVAWDRSAAVETVAWLAETFDLLADLPSDEASLQAFGAAALAALRPFANRIPEVIAQELMDAATRAGAGEGASGLVEAAASDTIDRAVTEHFADALVGLYTLSPQVGQRVKATLERLFPGMNVVVNEDHVRTDALDALAASADVMIVMLRSAKHAATGAISRVRPQHAPTLRLRCRGSTRIVQAFLDFAPTAAI